MARLSRLLPCPACGETMKVSRGNGPHKVCCPHCRQNVTIESEVVAVQPISAVADPKIMSDFTVSAAAAELEDILILCKEKRAEIEARKLEIGDLEARAAAVGRWLQTHENDREEDRTTRALIDLQARLFDQLRPLSRGSIGVRQCSETGGKALASCIRLTFEAFGWNVRFDHESTSSDYGEEITFVVAPGPVNYSVAAVYIALQSAGIRLRSQVDLEQPAEEALLWVHKISTIPRLLPSPKPMVLPAPEEALRRMA